MLEKGTQTRKLGTDIMRGKSGLPRVEQPREARRPGRREAVRDEPGSSITSLATLIFEHVGLLYHIKIHG